MKRRSIISKLPGLRHCRSDEAGAILVEFALILPVMLLFFGIMIESARTFWSYQLAVSGVRDASRYLSRSLPLDICTTTGAGTLTGAPTTTVTQIVNDDIGNSSTTRVFPPSVTVNSVTPVLTCTSAGAPTGGYRNGAVPIVTVTANLTIRFPLSFLWTWYGQNLATGTAVVADQARVFGQ